MIPFDVDKVRIDVSKHFRNTWLREWGWDQHDLREAIRDAYKTVKTGRGKWEVFVSKMGEKKLVIAYEARTNEVFVITGAES